MKTLEESASRGVLFRSDQRDSLLPYRRDLAGSHVRVTLTKDPHPTRLATPAETAGLETRGPISLRLLAIDASH